MPAASIPARDGDEDTRPSARRIAPISVTVASYRLTSCGRSPVELVAGGQQFVLQQIGQPHATAVDLRVIEDVRLLGASDGEFRFVLGLDVDELPALLILVDRDRHNLDRRVIVDEEVDRRARRAWNAPASRMSRGDQLTIVGTSEPVNSCQSGKNRSAPNRYIPPPRSLRNGTSSPDASISKRGTARF
jgi:hypothetical protein